MERFVHGAELMMACRSNADHVRVVSTTDNPPLIVHELEPIFSIIEIKIKFFSNIIH